MAEVKLESVDHKNVIPVNSKEIQLVIQQFDSLRFIPLPSVNLNKKYNNWNIVAMLWHRWQQY